MTKELEAVSSSRVGEANEKLKWGVGFGVFAVVSYAVLGAACPLCLVAGPALIGAGLVGRVRAKRCESSLAGGSGSTGG